MQEDITERKRLEKVKDEFVGTVSHELHGGKIWVESKLGEGSKFTSTLLKES